MNVYPVRVEIELEIFVVADSAEAAQRIAEDDWDREMENVSRPDFVDVGEPITNPSEIPAAWLGSAPYGDLRQFKDHRIERVVEQIEKERLEAAAKAPLPGQLVLPIAAED